MSWEKKVLVYHANALGKQLSWIIWLSKSIAEKSGLYLVSNEKKKNHKCCTEQGKELGQVWLINFKERLNKTNLNNFSQILTGWKQKGLIWDQSRRMNEINIYRHFSKDYLTIWNEHMFWSR